MTPTDRDATRTLDAEVTPEATLAVADRYSLDDVLDRLWLLAGERVRLAVPAGSSLFLTAAEFRQLREVATHQGIDLTLETEDPLRVQLAGMFGLPAVRVGGPLGPRRLPPPVSPAVATSNGASPSANGHAPGPPAVAALPDLPGNGSERAPGSDEREQIEGEPAEDAPRFREPGQPFTLRPVEDREPLEIPARAPGPPPTPELPKPAPQPVVAPLPPPELSPTTEKRQPIVASGAGAGRFDALRAAAARRTAGERNRQSLRRPAVALMTAAIAALVLGFFALFIVLPRATVTLQLKEQTVVAEASFLVLPPGEDVEPGTLAVAGEPETVELVYTATTETTGVAPIGDRPARGTVRLANPGDEPVTIEAGAVGAGDTGAEFRFISAVSVPAAADGASGQIDAEIEMIAPGTAGNLGPGELSGLLDSGVYFSNRSAALSGGTDIETRGVAQADLDALIARFEQDQRDLAEARFAESLPVGMAVAGSSLSFSEPEIQFDHGVGEPAETVTVTISQTVSGLVYDTEELMEVARPLLEEDLKSQVPADYALDIEEIAFSAPSTPQEAGEGEARIIVTAAGRAHARFDEDDRAALADQLAGESAASADDALAALPAVESYSVNYFPGLLLDRMPRRASRIEVVVPE